MRAVLFTSAAIVALVGSTALAADIPVYEETAPVAPVVSVFTWSGFYAGVHAGGAWGGHDDDSGCSSFTDLVAEGGGAPVFDSALDIVDVGGDGWGGFSVPGPGDDFPEGCEEVEISDGDPETNDLFSAFNLDGDYVAITGGGDDDDDHDLRWLAGAQIGINQQYGRLVLGLEADFSWIGDGDDDDGLRFGYFHEYDNDCIASCLTEQEGTGSVSGGSDIDWLATFRGRIGGAFGSEGRLLVYGTGGLAVAGVDDSFSASFDDDDVLDGADDVDWCDDPCGFFGASSGDDDDYEVGFAIGVGAEYAFTNNVSFGAEYMYVGFDDDEDGRSATFTADDGRSFDVSAGGGVDDLHIVRARLNWLFGPGGS